MERFSGPLIVATVALALFAAPWVAAEVTALDCSKARKLIACGTVTESACLAGDLATTARECLTVKADGVTIDGNGYGIRAALLAVNVHGRASVTLRNLRSPQGVQLYAGGGHVVEGSTLGYVGIYRGDDHLIRDSVLNKVVLVGQNGDPVERVQILDNQINVHDNPAIHITADHNGTPCDRGEHRIERNRLVSRCLPGSTTCGGNVFYCRCSSGNRIVGNTIEAFDRPGRGIMIRDEADRNFFSGNFVLMHVDTAEAFSIISGNVDKHHPRDNVVSDNVFVSAIGYSLMLQAGKTERNTFSNNFFLSSGRYGVWIADGAGNVFDHNTFVGTGAEKLAVLRDFGSGGTRFTSNVFAHVGQKMFVFDQLKDLRAYSGDYNVFFAYPGPVAFGSTGEGLAQWQATSGQDLHSIEAYPGFNDISKGDFSLAPDSPVRGAGEGGTDPGATP